MSEMSTNTASSTAPRHYAVFISYRHSDNVEMGRKWANWLHEVLSAPRDDGARARCGNGAKSIFLL
jgi:hypothetical protein